MAFLSLDRIVKARAYIEENTKKPDTFSGLVLFILCVVESKRKGSYLKSDMKRFSEMADEAFYLSDNSSSYSDKYWFALLTNDWLTQVKDYFLKGKKISAKQILYSLFWEKDFNGIQSIKSKIPKNIYDFLFEDDISEIDFEEATPLSKSALLSNYGGKSDALTIKFDGSFVKKKAGDLSGAPFGQTLYAATEIKKIISIFDFDFIEKFDLNDTPVPTKLSLSSSQVYLPKPFLLLSGISGTGKTRFVREQAKATNKLSETYCLTSVRPDWHEPSDLLGYISRLSNNGKAEYVTTDVLQFISKAWRGAVDRGLIIDVQNIEGHGERLVVMGDSDKLKTVSPYWLCLDEMNLAPVEQYFADYLSVLETREWQWENGTFTYSCDALLKPSTIKAVEDISKLRIDLGFSSADYDGLWNLIREYGLSIPFNLMVAGTVNMDETTHGFSRKVIDRALSIDFGEFFPNNYDEFFTPNNYNKPMSYPIWSKACKNDLVDTFDADGSQTLMFLTVVNSVLKNTPFELAYRALNELLLAVVSCQPQDNLTLRAVWDDFMMCKVLPRIEGDNDKLRTSSGEDLLSELKRVLAAQLSPIWDGEPNRQRPDLYRYQSVGNGSGGDDKTIRIACRSKGKLDWMKQRLESSTFTNFWP